MPSTRRKSTADAAPAAEEAAPTRRTTRRHSMEDTTAVLAAAPTVAASAKAGKAGKAGKAAVAAPLVVEEAEVGDEAPLFFIDREESSSSAPVATAANDAGEAVVEEAEGAAASRRKDAGKKQRRRQRQQEEEKGEEERLLERLVFGAAGGDAASLFVDSGRDGEGYATDAAETPRLRPAWQDEDDEGVQVDIAGKDRLRKLRTGPEEAAISGAEYQERLRARFQETQQSSALSWAALPADEGKGGKRSKKRRRRQLLQVGEEPTTSDKEDEEEEGQESDAGNNEDDAVFAGLFSSAAPLVASSSSSSKSATAGARLQPGVLEVLRCRDANLQEPSQAVVQAVQFHPSTGGLLLTAGYDKALRLFQVDGKRNEKVAGVFFPDLPIQSAAFVDPSGSGDFSQVVVSGRRPFFYWYDAVTGATGRVSRLLGREEKSLERFTASPDGRFLAFTGKDGYVLLVSAATKQWAGEFKMNGTARALAFSSDGQHLMASGGDAVVYRWDLRSRRCLARYRNEGGTVTSALAHSSGGLTAVGAESGVVNLYDDADTLLPSPPAMGEWDAAPVKALPNLTTAVDTLEFNHDGQLLAMASRWNRDALRVVHVPSRTVYANWPTGQTPIRYPSALSFSPNSGMLAVGNDRGRVLLYRLRHYDSS